MYKINILLLLILISGCAATNTIHNIRQEMRINSLKAHSAMHMVTSVSIDTEKGDLYFCMIGNFKGDMSTGDTEYTLRLKKEKIAEGNYILNDHEGAANRTASFSYKEFIDGCVFAGDDRLTKLTLRNVRVNTGHRRNKEIDIYNLPEAIKDVNSVTYIMGRDSASPDLSVNVYNDDLYNTDLALEIKGNNEYSQYASRFKLQNIYYGQDYDYHGYEFIGTITDILTAVIQVPVCVISLSHLCSLSPHPDLH